MLLQLVGHPPRYRGRAAMLLRPRGRSDPRGYILGTRTADGQHEYISNFAAMAHSEPYSGNQDKPPRTYVWGQWAKPLLEHEREDRHEGPKLEIVQSCKTNRESLSLWICIGKHIKTYQYRGHLFPSAICNNANTRHDRNTNKLHK